MNASPGRILLAATPIGCSDDASARLVDALAHADIVAGEDTRRVKALAVRLKLSISGRIVSLHEHNEAARADELIAAVEQGASVLVVTDAGTPTVSDPGYRLVQAAIERGCTVSALPGPSAALAALSVSGLPTDRFAFEGFLPRKPGALRAALADLASERRTLIFFESPRRLGATLAAMSGAFGAERRGVVARELTKVHEEIVRAPLGELAVWAESREVLGEITIVIEGAKPPEYDIAQLAHEALRLSESGERLKEACAIVAKRTGASANTIFRAALQLRGGIVPGE